jgi:anaerobic selenocysteine-containing dehydrogenase
MGLVHASRGKLAPASEHLRSEPAIVAGIARATLGADSPIPWDRFADDYAAIREAIAAVVPGFEDFETRAGRPGGFALPNAARERRWNTEGGRARFTTHEAPRWQLRDGELLMMTIRSHDQFNTTLYGLDDRYRGIRGGRRVVMMNAEDVAAMGLADGSLVDLTNRDGGVVRTAPRFRVVPYPIPRGCVATYFPEANALVPLEAVAAKSQTPASKSVVVTITPADVTPS